ncbi:MAG: membrane protein [Rhizobiaceae bacterium MnEN-MB40S]|nr:MAG: membrane protein [Rhizobiaceae bacterium MnEN-MB40S]
MRVLLATTAIALVTTTSYAADLVETTPMAPPVVIVEETNPFDGFYLGIHGGYGWQSGSYSGDGWLLGGQGGYNWVSPSGFLLGAEISGSWVDVGGSQSNVNGLGIAQGKLGWANDTVALYGTAGGAIASLKSSGFAPGFDDTPGGWTVGAGIDFMVVEDWSLGASYNYIDFGSNNSGGSDINVLKLNLNYNF